MKRMRYFILQLAALYTLGIYAVEPTDSCTHTNLQNDTICLKNDSVRIANDSIDSISCACDTAKHPATVSKVPSEQKVDEIDKTVSQKKQRSDKADNKREKKTNNSKLKSPSPKRSDVEARAKDHRPSTQHRNDSREKSSNRQGPRHGSISDATRNQATPPIKFPGKKKHR